MFISKIIHIDLVLGGISCGYEGYKQLHRAQDLVDLIKALALIFIGGFAVGVGAIHLLSTFQKDIPQIQTNQKCKNIFQKEFKKSFVAK